MHAQTEGRVCATIQTGKRAPRSRERRRHAPYRVGSPSETFPELNSLLIREQPGVLDRSRLHRSAAAAGRNAQPCAQSRQRQAAHRRGFAKASSLKTAPHQQRNNAGRPVAPLDQPVPLLAQRAWEVPSRELEPDQRLQTEARCCGFWCDVRKNARTAARAAASLRACTPSFTLLAASPVRRVPPSSRSTCKSVSRIPDRPCAPPR